MIRLSISLPDKVFMSGTTPALAISPDGRQIAFVATQEGQNLLWVRSLDSFTPKPLAGMEISGSPTPPFWSPDSRFVGFFAGGNLKGSIHWAGHHKLCAIFPRREAERGIVMV